MRPCPYSWRRRLAAVALLLGSLQAGLSYATAQKYDDEVTPAVQQLYSQASSAAQQGQTDVAIAKYRAMLKLAPHLAPAYNNLGVLYFNQGDFASAAQVLEKGVAVDPRMNTAWAMLGISEYRMGKYHEARTALEKAVAANPSDDLALMMLARDLVNLEEFDEATQKLRIYVARNPKDQEALYLLGKTYLRLSEETLGKINEINPDSVTAHEVAGEIDEGMHNYDGALAEYKRAIDLAPQEPGTHFHLANDFWLLQKWQSAEAEFQAELVNDPGNCQAEWKLGNSMLANKEPAENALPHLDKAVERCPALMQARVDRANALIKLDKPSDALTDLLIAEKDTPNEPSIHFLLSRAYKALNKPTEASLEIETYGRLQREASEATAERTNDVMKIKSAAQ
jgi:tetratricopeptide (TPR) repeat protein